MQGWRRTALGLLMLATLAPACSGDDGGGRGDAEATTASTSTTATTGGEVVVDDPFDDDANEWGPGGARDAQMTKQVEGGELVFRVRRSLQPDDTEVLPPGLVWPTRLVDATDEVADQRVETTVRFTQPGLAGVACRLSESINRVQGYYFQVGSSGVVVASKLGRDGRPEDLDGVPLVDEPVLPDDPAFAFEPDRSYDVAAECTGGQDGDPVLLSLTIDGEEVLVTEDTDEPVPAGVAGLVVGQSALMTQVDGFEPFTVAYDSFTVTDLGG